MTYWENSAEKLSDIRPRRIRSHRRKYAIVVGTRPEIIKMAPVIRELERQSIQHIVIHSGQHYSLTMDSDIFENLNLPQPDYNLKVGSDSGKKQIKRIRKSLEKEYDRLLDYVSESLKKGNGWKNPYGDGKAAKRIVRIVQNNWHRGDNSEKALFALRMSGEKSLLLVEPQRISSFFKTRI